MLLCLQGLDDYPLIIEHPMDLRTAREKLRAGAYSSMAEWYADVKRIWDNCRKYNGKDSHYTLCAEKLEAAVERHLNEAPPAVAAAARKPLAVPAAQQRAGAGSLAGKRPVGGSKPRVPGDVALLHESIDLAVSDSGGDGGGEDGRQARPARTVSNGMHHCTTGQQKILVFYVVACSPCFI
jgi:hypothetical protein